MMQNWLTASPSQRKEILRACFESAKAQFPLEGLQLSFQMPTGYEEANGTYDVTVNTLFLNPDFLSTNSLELPFYFLHELRHAMQYLHPEQFPGEIQCSLPYVILHNGFCYKLVDGVWRELDLSGADADFENSYLSLPYELDANRFAYDTLWAEFPEQTCELDKLLAFWTPKQPVPHAELVRLFQLIDAGLRSV